MSTPKPHFSFWIFAGLGLLWNLMGCLNFIAQSNAETVAQMPEIYQMIINNRPSWATGAFAIGVFGGAVGCILLLLRKRVGQTLLLMSLVGIVVTMGYTLRVVGLSPSTLMAFLVGLALFWYSTIANRKGWLTT